MILRLGRRSGTAIFLALLILLGACSANAVMQVPPLFDDAGRPKAITYSAQRVVTLAPALTELVYAANAQDKLVGVSAYSDYPDAAKTIPHLKDHQKVDSEALRAYQPEVVFTATLVQEKLAEKLRSEEFAVVHQDPRSITDIYDSIRQIGIILGCEARAQALVAVMQQGFNDTKRKSGLFFRKPRVYVEEWHHPPMASGNWVPEIVKIAGGIPFPLTERVYSPAVDAIMKNPPSREVNLAEIQQFDPDVIVLSICGAGQVANKELLTGRAGWNELRSVQENHLFVIDDSLLNRPGPRLTEGAKRLFGWMFQALH